MRTKLTIILSLVIIQAITAQNVQWGDKIETDLALLGKVF